MYWKLILFSLAISAHAMGSLENLSLQRGCRLTDQKGEHRNFPGAFCLFQDDGTFISADESVIRKYSPERRVLWEVRASAHHQINLSPDKKRILAHTYKLEKKERGTVRVEGILILDQDGKIIAETDAERILKSANITSPNRSRFNFELNQQMIEDSHFNSIYEIGDHKRAKEIPWLQPGNIIVNSLYDAVYVLTPDLKTVLKRIPLENLSVQHQIHDVQLSSDGNLLFFNNQVKDSKHHPYSAVQKVDPHTNKVVFEITGTPKIIFYSTVMGSVQELEDYYVFSHMTTGGYLYSKKAGQIVKTWPEVMDTIKSIQLTQELKLINAAQFLKNFR